MEGVLVTVAKVHAMEYQTIRIRACKGKAKGINNRTLLIRCMHVSECKLVNCAYL